MQPETVGSTQTPQLPCASALETHVFVPTSTTCVFEGQAVVSVASVYVVAMFVQPPGPMTAGEKQNVIVENGTVPRGTMPPGPGFP